MKESTPLPEIVARVGDETITGADFQRQLDFSAQMMSQRGMTVDLDDKQKRSLLEDVVRETVAPEVKEDV